MRKWCMTTEDNMRFGCLGMIAAITFWVALVALVMA